MAHPVESNHGSRRTSPSTKNYHLLWVVQNPEKLKREFAQPFNELQLMASSTETFSDADLFIDYFYENNHKKTIVLIASPLVESVLPIIHDAPNLDSIYIFCIDQRRHEDWAKDRAKVGGVFNDIATMCETVKQTLRNGTSDLSERDRSSHRDPSTSHAALEEPCKKDTIDDDKRSIPLMNSRTPKKFEAPNLEQLRASLITITEQKVGQSLRRHPDADAATSLATDVVDRLQHTIMTSTARPKTDDANELNRLFADLKQTLVSTLDQQQPLLLQQLVKQTVADALKEQHSSTVSARRSVVALATSQPMITKSDQQKTRTDAAFRQQRDSVVTNKPFRDTVQQWSTVSSMTDLAAQIKTIGSNDLEYA